MRTNSASWGTAKNPPCSRSRLRNFHPNNNQLSFPMNPSDSTPSSAPRLIRISPQDHVAVAVAAIEPGESLTIAGLSITAADRIPAGHKLALIPIAAGQKVLKYGAPIGSATRAIRPGEHVHTHNLKSDYLLTYTLDGSSPYLREE